MISSGPQRIQKWVTDFCPDSIPGCVSMGGANRYLKGEITQFLPNFDILPLKSTVQIPSQSIYFLCSVSVAAALYSSSRFAHGITKAENEEWGSNVSFENAPCHITRYGLGNAEHSTYEKALKFQGMFCSIVSTGIQTQDLLVGRPVLYPLGWPEAGETITQKIWVGK